MSKLRLAVLLLVLIVLAPLLPSAVPLPGAGGADWPRGAAESAPEQRSGTAGGPHDASADSTRTALQSPRRDQPRPSGAVPDHPAAPPEVDRHVVAPGTVQPAMSPRLETLAIDPKAVEVPDERTELTETFRNPDGTRTIRTHAAQKYVRGQDGSLRPVDLTLATGERLAPKVAPVPVSFAPSAAAADLVRVDLGEGRELTYGLRAAADVRAATEGPTALYKGVREGVDLRLSSTSGGMKDELVLASAAAANAYEFSLRTKGVRPRLTESGAVELLQGDHAVAVIPPGFMQDAAATRSTDVRYALEEHRDGTWTLRMEAARGWLTDPARVFPVVIDPAVITFTGTSDDTYVRPGEPGKPGDSVLGAGRIAGQLTRSYLRFNVPAALRDKYVVGASLVLDNVYSSTCTPRPVTVFEVTQGWGTDLGWPGAAVGAPLGAKSFAHGESCGPAAWEGIPLDADAMTRWTHGWGVQHGFSVRATDENDGHGKRFASHDSANPPYLDVRYSPVGAAFEVVRIVLPTNVDEGRLVAKVTNQGAETWAAGGAVKFGHIVEGRAPRVEGVLPHAVAPGQSATLDVALSPIAPGEYKVRLSMWGPDGRNFFEAHEVPYGVFLLRVHNLPPTTNYQQPPNGATVETRTPTLYAKGIDPDRWPEKGLTYKYRICTDQALTLNCEESDWTGQSWVPRPLFWSRTYFWGIKVSDTVADTPGWATLALTTRVHQPEITSHLAGSPGSVEGPGLDPQIGNYSAVVTDASVATVGPDLTISRTYNSLDPRKNTAFGTGWSSRLDMRLEPDEDGSGNVVVTLASGRQIRFGRNPDGTFAAPAGQAVDLVYVDGGEARYVLRDVSGSRWVFDLPGRLVSIFDPAGLEEKLTYDGQDRVATISNLVSGRTLTITWTGAHVAQVRTDAPRAGAQPLAWTYTYTGDRLTKACGPGTEPGCTNYQHQNGSHYRSTVLDNAPRAYYRFGETTGSTFGTVTARRPGADAATQHGVVLGADGAIAGTADKAGLFDGSSSRVAVPEKLISESMSSSVELWFRTTAHGVLVSYADKPFPDTSTQSTPLLYVGTDGLLYGGFAIRGTGGARQIVSTAEVADGRWHHAVLSAAVSTQTLYLDGVAVGTLPGLVDHRDRTHLTVGAGSGKDWPATNGGAFHFNGAIDEVAFYSHTVGALAARRHHAAGQSSDLLSSVSLPRNNKHATLTYDDLQDRVRTLVDHQGRTWTLDTPTVLDAVRTAVLRGPSTHGDWTYTADLDQGGRTSTKSHNGVSTKYEYNTAGFPSATVDENGHRTEQTTDPRGNVLSRKTCRTTGSCNTTYYTYVTSADPLDPRRDKLASTSDARSTGPDDTRYRTSYTYDTRGMPTGVTHPKADGVAATPSQTSIYSTGTEDAVGGGKTPKGVLIRDAGPRGQTTTREYRANGDLALVVSPSGLRTSFEYDLLGRQRTATVSNSGLAVIGVSTTEYDDRGQITKTTAPTTVNAVTGASHTRVTDYSYDANGNVTRTTVSDNGQQPRTTRTAYDDSDRVSETTFPDNTKETRTYQDNALTLVVKDARGTEWVTRHDEHGRVLQHEARGSGVDPENAAATSLRLEARSYDPAGRLFSVTDAIGRRTDFGYYDDDLLATTTRIGYTGTDGTRRDVLLDKRTYDPAGNLVEQVAPGGATTAHTFDAAGFVTTSTFDPAGLNRKTTFQRDAAGNPTRVEVRGAANPDRVETTSYQYNVLDQVVREDAHLDASTVLSTVLDRDERGLVRSSTDRRQITTRYEYDAAGSLVRTIDPATDAWVNGTVTRGFNRANSLGYNAFGEVTQSKDGTGAVSVTEYDVMGRVIAGTVPDYTPPGGQPIKATTRTKYDQLGNAVEQQDPLGRVTVNSHDPYGRVLTSTLPQVGTQPSVLTYRYNRAGELAARTDPQGAETRATYDELGRQITTTAVERTTDPVAFFTTRTEYDDAGNVLAVETPQGNRKLTTYNRAGEPVTSTDPTGRVTELGYDLAGRQVTRKDPTGVVSATGYDLLGRAVRAAQSVGGQELRASVIDYDGNGNVVRKVSPEGRTTTFGYDELNRQSVAVEQIDAGKSITVRTGYDTLGNRSRFVDGKGNVTDYTYTPWGLPESTVEPATSSTPALADRTWTTVYDAAGQIVSLRKPGGVTTSREYDAQGRLTAEKSTGATDRSFGYDRAGRSTRVDGAGGATSYFYDDRGNLISQAGAAGTATYTYDGDGTVATRTDATGKATFTYDPAGRLKTVADPVTSRTASYGYDSAGRLSSTVDTSVGGRVLRQFGYDALSRLASDRLDQFGEPGVPPRTIIGVDYAYDRDDKLKSKSGNNYGYDGAGRLTSWTDPAGAVTAYGWDDAGNRTSAGADTFTYDERNRLKTGPGETYSYTPRGTLASVTANGSTRTPEFDGFDRLVRDGAAVYGYDSLDRVASRNGTKFTYAGLTNEAVSDGRRLISRLPDGSAFSDKATGGTGRMLFADRRGDVIGRYLNNSVDGKRTFDPFGKVTASSGDTSSIGFQGDWTDPDTGTVNMSARWYAPGAGQFISRDSATLDPSPSSAANRFQYGDNDPIGNIDPTGHDAISDICELSSPGRDKKGKQKQKSGVGGWLDIFTGFICGSPLRGDQGCGGMPGGWHKGDNGDYYCPYTGRDKPKNTGSRGMQLECSRGASCYDKVGPGAPRPPVGPGPGVRDPKRPNQPRTNPPRVYFSPPPPPRWAIDALTALGTLAAGATVVNRAIEIHAVGTGTQLIDRTLDLVDDATRITRDTPRVPLPIPVPVGEPENEPEPDEDFDEDECFAGLRDDEVYNTPREKIEYTKNYPGKHLGLKPKRATGGIACLMTTVPSEGREKPGRPIGYEKGHHSSHIIGHQLHGDDYSDNLVPLDGNVNTPDMLAVENAVARHLNTGQRIFYQVTVNYADLNGVVPVSMTIIAKGDMGFFCSVIIRNPRPPNGNQKCP